MEKCCHACVSQLWLLQQLEEPCSQGSPGIAQGQESASQSMGSLACMSAVASKAYARQLPEDPDMGEEGCRSKAGR